MRISWTNEAGNTEGSWEREGRGARVKAWRKVEKVGKRRRRPPVKGSGAQGVSSTGRGPHSTEVDVGALDQPLLRMHESKWNRHPVSRQLA
ncbi:hypothetical protein GCM10010306_039970 [Streptomyces umbrinus]|nr:hypothetical protein GCM10010306_039970 [Streptomyces umbrinus]GHH48027.1 hypothetical protein GCM10018775_41790 [Streptomyces umbrinus]